MVAQDPREKKSQVISHKQEFSVENKMVYAVTFWIKKIEHIIYILNKIKEYTLFWRLLCVCNPLVFLGLQH